MVKVYTAAIKSKPLDIENNYVRALDEVKKAVEMGAQLIVFPQGFLSGVQLGVLEGTEYFEQAYNSYAQRLSAERGDIPIIADKYVNKCYGSAFETVLYRAGQEEMGEMFLIDGCIFATASKKAELELWEDGGFFHFDCIIYNASEPVLAGERHLIHSTLRALSQRCGATIVVNLGGWGFTSHPDVYLPAVGCVGGGVDVLTTTLGEYLSADKMFEVDAHQQGDSSVVLPSLEFDIAFNQNPLVPCQIPEKEYCLDLFHLQSVALAARLDNIGLKSAVVAVSGGLDSAMALLVTVNAFDLLGLDRRGIHPVSMPGFGTSGTTKSLAQQLIESLGYEFKLIDITKSAHQALLDIGHDGVTPDVTFENVQARMRTLNGLNLANALGGIMIGTGDLSEEALGFSTYGGDHLASYNVNSSVSKTVIRTMLPYVTALPNLASAREPIDKILNIPVSPELVPHGGEILQKTEEILAPYKLIDFYIYCFAVAHLSPKAMAEKAKEVFGDEFDTEYLMQKAEMFCRRFISGQFKRSCAPEGAALTHAHLNGEARAVPSDSSMSLFRLRLK